MTPFRRCVRYGRPGGRDERGHVTDHLDFKGLTEVLECRAFKEGVRREVRVALAPGAGLGGGEGTVRLTSERGMQWGRDEQALPCEEVGAAEVLVGLALEHAL